MDLWQLFTGKKRARPDPTDGVGDPPSSGGEEPAAKRARRDEKKSATIGGSAPPPRPLIKDTLLVGAEFARGSLQTPAAVRAAVAVTSKPAQQVLAPRREQNALTLAPPTLRPLVEFVADRMTWLDGSVAPHNLARQLGAQFFLAAKQTKLNPDAPQEQRRAAALIAAADEQELALALSGKSTAPDVHAPQLLSTPRRHPPRSVRLVDPVLGPIGPHTLPAERTSADGGGKKASQKAGAALAYNAAHLSYYADDPEPDPELPFGLPPATYPSHRAVAEAREAYLARRTHMRQDAENMPRKSIPTLNRAYLQKSRVPCALFPEAEQRRPCARESACVVCVLAYKEGRPHYAYNPPEFLLKTDEDELLAAVAAGPAAVSAWYAKRGPPGLCIDCTLWDWSVRVLMHEHSQKPPEHPINTFRVPVGPGEYGPDALLPTEVYNVRTGIEGHVPAYDECYRQFDLIENGRVVLREVNVDFHLSLSQTNACLGAPKARPLAGTSHSTLPLRSIAAVCAHVTQTAGVGAMFAVPDVVCMWHHYGRTLPLPLLADRALTGHAASRVPAVWLRRSLLLLNNMSEELLSPVAAAAVQVHVALPILRRIAHALVGPDDLGHVAAALAAVARVAFCPFAETVDWVLAQPAQGSRLLSGPLAHFVAHGRSISTALVRPPGWAPETPLAHVLFSAALWRIAVAHMFELVMSALPSAQAPPNYAYWSQLFADTHLDLLTLLSARVVGARPADDRFFLRAESAGGEAPLTRVYPQGTRVCCAEELPAIGVLLRDTNRFHDMPSKKQNNSQKHVMAQMYLKTDGHVGKMRSSDDIFPKAMKSYPGIHELFQLVLRAALLGNFPQCGGRPPLPARIRINACFAPSEALSGEPDTAEHRAEVQRWVGTHPMLTIALLREHYLYAVEMDAPLDHVFGQSRNWHMFKAVARLCTTQLRRAVAAMLLADGGRGRVDWEGLESRQGGKKTSTGEIVRWHEREKEFYTKLFKDVDYAIMLKKMTAVERKHIRLRTANGDIISWDRTRTKPDEDTSEDEEDEEEDAKWSMLLDEDDIRAWLAADGRCETLHTLAWTAAQTMFLPFPDGTVRPALPTGGLKFVGIDRASFEAVRPSFKKPPFFGPLKVPQVRRWMHATVDYHTSDDSFTRVSREVLQRDWRSFLGLKLYLRLVAHYVSDVVGYTSVEQARAQLTALRASLTVRGYVATPPALGYAYLCEACMKWAAQVVRPSREYLGLATQKAPRSRKQASAAPATKHRKKVPVPRPWPARPAFVGDGRAGCTRNTAFNPHTNTLLCLCGCPTSRDAAAVAAALGEAEEVSGDTDDDDDDDEDAGVRLEIRRAGHQAHEEEEEEADDGPSRARRNGLKTDIAQWLLDGERRGQPLLTIDLVGVYKRFKNILYGLCCYCGRLCEVLNSNVTNGGLSCGAHAFPAEYPKWHPIWRHLRYPTKAQASPVGHVAPLRPCYKCGHRDAAHEAQFWVYDAFYRIRQITLCGFHVHILKEALAQTRGGERPILLRLALVAEQLRTRDV